MFFIGESHGLLFNLEANTLCKFRHKYDGIILSKHSGRRRSNVEENHSALSSLFYTHFNIEFVGNVPMCSAFERQVDRSGRFFCRNTIAI